MKLPATFLLVFVTFFSVSQPNIKIEKISVSDGLSNGRVYNITRDSLGYIWLATANGLTRYSGTQFKKYPLHLKDNLSDPSVLKLHLQNNKLYALLQGGVIYKYNYEYDKWESILEVTSGQFMSISSLSENELLVGTTAGFYIYDLQNDSLSAKMFEEFRYIRKLERIEDELLLSTSSGVQILTIKNDNQFEVKHSILQKFDILDFEMDASRALWVGTDGDGLFKYDKGEVGKLTFTDNPNISVRDIYLNNNGNVLLAVDRRGLFQLDPFGNTILKVSYDPLDDNSLSQNSINTIYNDEEGVIWLGIGEIGLNLLHESKSLFKNIFRDRYASNFINNEIIRAIYQDKKGNLWFGTEGGLSKRDPDGVWTNYDKLSEATALPVLTITSYQDQLVFGTYGQGLMQLNPATNEVKKFNSKIKTQRVYATLWEDGYLWVGGIDGPLYQLLGDSIVATYSADQVKTLVRKEQGKLLVGSVEGISEIDIEKKTLSKYTIGSRPLANIYSLQYDKQSDLLWVGTDNGLLKMDYTSGDVKGIREFSELSGAVYSILKGENSTLWIAAEKGLFKYETETGSYRIYSDEEGQLISEFGFGARAKLVDQQLAFGGPKGAVIFSPNSIKPDNNAPKVYISDFLINGSEYRNEGAKNINFLSEIVLAHNENTLQVQLDIINFHGSNYFKVEWQLEGLDEEVITSVNQPMLTYRNVSPGNYTLKTRVFNADGVVSANEVLLNIEILYPYWLRWWAFLIYGIILFTFTYIFIALNRVSQDRKLSDEKIKFFIDVAHDIRTPVSLIRLASNQLLDKQNIEESVQIINRYTKNLNEYVTELLDFQKSERNKLGVAVAEFDLVHLLAQIIEDFKPLSEQKNIEVITDAPESLMIWADKVQIGRVFTNILSNAIKYNHENGEVKVIVSETGDTVNVEIRDTGLGIPKGQIDQIFTRFHRADNALNENIRGTGIGLMLSKRIVELHKGRISVESEENKGSAFIISLLKGKLHFNPADIRVAEKKERIDKLTAKNVEGKHTVLVIEDNEDILNFIEKSLSEDYFVIRETDGKEGLMSVFAEHPDLIITDVMLPGKNGKEICHIVKNDKNVSSIPVIILTALTGIDDKIAGLEVGADYYLEKPFDIDVLKLAIKNLLKRSQLDKEINNSSQDNYKGPEESLLSNVIDLVNTNITDHNYSIDELCDEIGLSRSNLFRKIKTITGMSISDFILEIKLNKAKNLLQKESNIRIDHVAYQCGFHDPKYFSTIFKKHFKKTPTEYHSLYKNK